MNHKVITCLKSITKRYSNEHTLTIFENANFEVYQGEFIAVFAPSGYGKTTLLNLISGLDKPDSGQIVIVNTDITKLSKRKMTLFRRNHIGIVFQFFNLFPTLTALENVMLPIELKNGRKVNARKRALELLELVNMGDNANKFPAQLSGGEQQRVAIARALANNPDIILADEPTGNLDEANAIMIFKLLKELSEKEGKTIVMATHDVEHASKFVDRAVTIKNKKIVGWERRDLAEGVIQRLITA
ncbi:MAG: ABC transporter ATP-binding protein [Candidatus Asgardarchaeia archaeon]